MLLSVTLPHISWSDGTEQPIWLHISRPFISPSVPREEPTEEKVEMDKEQTRNTRDLALVSHVVTKPLGRVLTPPVAHCHLDSSFANFGFHFH